MSFTPGDDINIIQKTDLSIVGAGAGNDVYIIDDAVLSPNQSVEISDSLGNNTIHLVSGLEIKEALVASSAIELVFNNGATIDVLDADHYNFLLGGDCITGKNGTNESFSDFVTKTLGLSGVPQPGQVEKAYNITIGGNNFNVINVYDNQTFTGTDGPDEFKFDAVTALQDANETNTQATIVNFDVSNDLLDIIMSSANSSVSNLSQLDGVDGVHLDYDPFDNTTIIGFGNDQNGGEAVTISLVGITQDEWNQVHVQVEGS